MDPKPETEDLEGQLRQLEAGSFKGGGYMLLYKSRFYQYYTTEDPRVVPDGGRRVYEQDLNLLKSWINTIIVVYYQ